MVKIKKNIIDSMIEHARWDVPIEACGYLAGKQGVITKLYKLKNVDNSHEHFSFDPEEQFEVMRNIWNEGLELLGNYHSHPLTPARPSQEDIRLAADPQTLYFIVSLAEDNPVVKAFKIINKEVNKIELKIID